MEDVYELYIRGTELLESGHNHQATIPLARARDLAPDKTSIREALGRALFGAQRYEEAAEEFQAVIDRAPTNDYALFCLGRSLQMLGRHAEARQPLAQAAGMQPGRHDYRIYRDRARARAAANSAPGNLGRSEAAIRRRHVAEPNSLRESGRATPRLRCASRWTPETGRSLAGARAAA